MIRWARGIPETLALFFRRVTAMARGQQPPQPMKPRLGDRLGDDWIKQEIWRLIDGVEELSTPRITLDVSDRVYDLMLAQTKKQVVIIHIGAGAPTYSGLTPVKGENGMGQYLLPNDTPDGKYNLPPVV